MSDASLSVESSPQSPGGMPGQGVRRLNRIPLFIILGVLVVAMSVLAWAVYQRAQARQQAEQEQTVIQQQDMGHVVDQLMAGYQDGGMVASSQPEEVVKPEVETEEVGEAEVVPEPVKPLPVPRRDAPAVTASPESQLSPEEQAALQQYTQIRQRAFQSTLQALQAPTAVGGGGFQSGSAGNVLASSQLKQGGTELEQATYDSRQLRERETALRNSSRQRVKPVVNRQPEPQVGRSLLSMLAGNGLNRSIAGAGQAGPQGVSRQQNGYGYSEERRQFPRSATELRVGTLIPAVMISGINSDLPGEILAQVTEAVRDSRSGQFVLIPQGAKLVGRYVSDVAEGQERVLVAWYRVNFPDGSFLNLEAMNGVDQAGYGGFHDKVNKHTFDKFKEATLLSLISGGVQLSQSRSDDASRQLAAALGQQWGTVGEEVVKRKLERAPTLEVRPGYRFNVFLNRDLVLEIY